MVKSGKTQAYDYGSEAENLHHYGQVREEDKYYVFVGINEGSLLGVLVLHEEWSHIMTCTARE